MHYSRLMSLRKPVIKCPLKCMAVYTKEPSATRAARPDHPGERKHAIIIVIDIDSGAIQHGKGRNSNDLIVDHQGRLGTCIRQQPHPRLFTFKRRPCTGIRRVSASAISGSSPESGHQTAFVCRSLSSTEIGFALTVVICSRVADNDNDNDEKANSIGFLCELAACKSSHQRWRSTVYILTSH